MIDDFDIEIVPLSEKIKTIKINTPKTVSLKKKRKSKKEVNDTNTNNDINNNEKKKEKQKEKKKKEKQTTKKVENNRDTQEYKEDNIEKIKLKKERKRTEKKKTEIKRENEKPTQEKKERTKKKTKIESIPIVTVNKVNSIETTINKTPEYLLNNSVTLSRKKSPKKKSPVKIRQQNKLHNQHNQSNQYQLEYNYKLIEARRRKREIEKQLNSLKKKQINRSNPVQEYFKNKKKSPPRKHITINPEYNFNIPRETRHIATKKQSYKTKTKQFLLKKRDALLKLKAKKTQKKQNMLKKRDYINTNFKLKYKSPHINTLEYKKQKLKEQRLLELKKIQLKKQKILEIQSKESEIKIMNDIKKEQQLIKKLQDEQYKLDKLQYMYIEKHKRKPRNIKDNQKKKRVIKESKEQKITEQLTNKKQTIKYSVDGIPLNNIKSINKDNISLDDISSDELDIYSIDDFSNIEDFSTDYKEEIWEYNINNEKYNNLLFENKNSYNIDESDESKGGYYSNVNDDNTLINNIKYKLIHNCYIKKEDSLSNDMLIILYKNLIKQKKILLL